MGRPKIGIAGELPRSLDSMAWRRRELAVGEHGVQQETDDSVEKNEGHGMQGVSRTGQKHAIQRTLPKAGHRGG